MAGPSPHGVYGSGALGLWVSGSIESPLLRSRTNAMDILGKHPASEKVPEGGSGTTHRRMWGLVR